MDNPDMFRDLGKGSLQGIYVHDDFQLLYANAGQAMSDKGALTISLTIAELDNFSDFSG